MVEKIDTGEIIEKYLESHDLFLSRNITLLDRLPKSPKTRLIADCKIGCCVIVIDCAGEDIMCYINTIAVDNEFHIKLCDPNSMKELLDIVKNFNTVIARCNGD